MNIHQQKLAIVKGFVGQGQVFGRLARHLFDDGFLTLEKTEHNGSRGLPWSDRYAISTYDDCVELKIERDSSGNEWIRLYIWDGDTLYGKRQSIRTCYTFKGEWWRSRSILERLEFEFKYVCDLQVKLEDKKQHELRVEIMGQKLLTRLVTERMMSSGIKPEPVTQVELDTFPSLHKDKAA